MAEIIIMDETDEYPVKVHIYDLTKGLARSMSGPLLGQQIDGVWHTGIVVHGQEFYFGGMGIESCDPCGTMLGQPDKVEHLGNTQIPNDMFLDYLQELGASSFRPEKYNLLEHNCNTFSDEIAKFLTGCPIPAYIINLPQEVLNTPLGAMLRPFIDAMSVNPSGGHAILPSAHAGQSESISTPSHPPAPAPHQANQPAEERVLPSGQQATPPVKPVSFREIQKVLLEFAEVRENLRKSLSSDDVKLVEEIVEYLKADVPDWGLSRSHVVIMDRILRDSSFTVDQKVAAAGLLQESLGHEDVVMMLVHDPHSTYVNILHLFEQHSTQVNERLAKGLCNCSCLAEGLKWLTVANGATTDGAVKISLDVCRYCLLHTEKILNQTGAALCHNLTRNKLSEELAFDLGCALVELLQRDHVTDTAKHGILALCQCIDCNGEVGDMALISGIDPSILADKHPELKQLCDGRLKQCLSRHNSLIQ